MNEVGLLAHYERIMGAPGAISRLRGFILDLSVHGKLVAQDAEDEPAPELLMRIAAAEPMRMKLGSSRDNGNVQRVESEPFKIPSTWQWVRLGDLGTTQTGSTPPKSRQEYYGSDVPFIRPGDLYPTRVDYLGQGLSHAGADALGRLAPCGSLLMVCIGTVGKCQVVDRLVSFNQQINALSPAGALTSNYALAAMRSNYFQKSAWSASAKTTISILNKGNWEKLLLPVPPLAEQHRIGAKVDELMGLCDRIETAVSDVDNIRSRLLEALLHEAFRPLLIDEAA